MYKIKLLTICVALTNAISLNEDKKADVKPIDVKDQKMAPVEPVSHKAAGVTKDHTNNLAEQTQRESRREERKKKRESERNSAAAQKKIEDQNAANKEKEAPVEKEKAVPETKAGAEKAKKSEINAAQVAAQGYYSDDYDYDNYDESE